MPIKESKLIKVLHSKLVYLYCQVTDSTECKHYWNFFHLYIFYLIEFSSTHEFFSTIAGNISNSSNIKLLEGIYSVMVSPFISFTYWYFMLFIYLFYFQIKGKRKEEILGINISSVTLLKMGSKEKDGRISRERLDSWTICEIPKEGLISENKFNFRKCPFELCLNWCLGETVTSSVEHRSPELRGGTPCRQRFRKS